jgi:hypothetical protein
MASTASKLQGSSNRPETTGRQIVQQITPGRINYKPAIALALLLATFVILQWLLPLGTAIKIGADEDFELAKITLSLKGYKFYTEVWNDQPLLHTSLITQAYKHLLSSALAPRLVTSAFAVLLLTSVFFISLRISGLLVAALTTALLIASPGFLELSASCMVEIPALAPAVASLGLLLIGRQTKWRIAEIFVGVLFAAALQIKFIAAVYLPMVGLILWLRRGEASSLARFHPNPLPQEREGVVPQSWDWVRGSSVFSRFFPAGFLRSLLFFVASLAICFIAVIFVTDQSSYFLQLKQSWSAHFASAKSFEYGSPADHPFEWSILLKNWDLTVPAVLGIICSLRQVRRTPAAIVPVAWLALTLVVFATHKPWWSYYYIHNAVPLCLCAAAGLEALRQRFNWRRNQGPSLVFAVYVLCALLWMGARIYLQIDGIRKSPQTYSSLVLTEIERFKPFTKLIYTHEPVYSFHSGIPMPPKLAIVSLKRLWSGDMTNAKIEAELWETKPGLIMLANDTRAVPFQDLLEKEYRMVYQDDKHRLYAHRSIASKAQY